MIRGINKRIIEINEIGSDYFEKVMFIVKSENIPDDAQLEREAKKIMMYYMSDVSPREYKGLRYKEKMRHKKAILIISSVIVCFVFGLIFLISFK